MRKVIVAEFVNDMVEPYASQGGGIPVVLLSTHPRFQEGRRFDYGFLKVALAQGYDIHILSTGRPMTESGKNIFGEM